MRKGTEIANAPESNAESYKIGPLLVHLARGIAYRVAAPFAGIRRRKEEGWESETEMIEKAIRMIAADCATALPGEELRDFLHGRR